MDEFPNGYIAAVEDHICQVPHIQRCRIVSKGRHITEVHVIADIGKDARSIVRDVETAVMARFGTRLDRRIIGVVCMPVEAVPEADSILATLDEMRCGTRRWSE